MTEAEVSEFVDACLCPWCGKGPFRVLPKHTGQAHGVDAKALRAAAGRTSNEPISSPEFRARARELAIERGGEELMRNMKGAIHTREELSEAALKKMSDTMRATMASLTPQQRSEGARRASNAVPVESRKRQGRIISERARQKREAS